MFHVLTHLVVLVEGLVTQFALELSLMLHLGNEYVNHVLNNIQISTFYDKSYLIITIN